MFSTSASWTSFFRFNTAWGWGEREEQGVKRLGELIREQLPEELIFIPLNSRENNEIFYQGRSLFYRRSS
jgi:hypothetical protein